MQLKTGSFFILSITYVFSIVLRDGLVGGVGIEVGIKEPIRRRVGQPGSSLPARPFLPGTYSRLLNNFHL
jgi:hypothetical protein